MDPDTKGMVVIGAAFVVGVGVVVTFLRSGEKGRRSLISVIIDAIGDLLD